MAEYCGKQVELAFDSEWMRTNHDTRQTILQLGQGKSSKPHDILPRTDRIQRNRAVLSGW